AGGLSNRLAGRQLGVWQNAPPAKAGIGNTRISSLAGSRNQAAACPERQQNWERTMQHSPRFLKIVDDARSRVKETNVDEIKSRMDEGERFTLIDVREESEFAKDHLPRAIHMGKGVIERDIEQRLPDLDAELVLYCGGGYRSALAADNLQKMGYRNVLSMDGGIRVWREKNYPLEK